jgi:hypothetical protein
MMRLAIAGLLLCCWCGCGRNDGVQRATVTGRVTFGGAEITEGSIAFYPIGATKGPSAGGAIQKGRYAVAAAQGPVVGRNRVEIRGPLRKTGRKIQSNVGPPGVMMDEEVEAVPDRYNSKSTLNCEIKPGNNTLDFELATK